MKNQGFAGNIIVAFLSAISFTFGGAAVGNPFASVHLSLITFFLFTGRETLKDVQDVKGDVLYRTTLPMKIGEKNAAIVGSVFLGVIFNISFVINRLDVVFIGFLMAVWLICRIYLRSLYFRPTTALF